MRQELYRSILRITAVPLAILLYLMILSGYGLTKSEIVQRVTFSILDYVACINIHTSPLIRIIIITLAILHAIAGFELWMFSVRGKFLRRIIRLLLWILVCLIAVQFLIIELA